MQEHSLAGDMTAKDTPPRVPLLPLTLPPHADFPPCPITRAVGHHS